MADKYGVQGKLDHDIIIAGLLNKKKKTDIAREAGSLAKTPPSLVNSVNAAMKTPSFQKRWKSVQERLETEVDRLISNISESALESVEYRDKIQAISKLIEKIELLKGRATHRVNIDIGEVQGYLDNA